MNIKLRITAVTLKITVLYSQWPHCISFFTAHDVWYYNPVMKKTVDYTMISTWKIASDINLSLLYVL